MATGKNIKGITIEFNGDTTKLGKAINDIDKKTKGLDSDLKQVNKALKFNPGNVELLAQKQQIFSQKVNETKSRLEALKAAQAKLDDDPAVEKTSQDYMSLRREIIETESKLKHFEGQVRALNNVKLTALGTQLKRTGDKMQAVGKAATKYVTTPIVTGLGAAVKTTMSFDTAMSQVAATMGKTTQQMEAEKVTTDSFSGSLRELALEMGSRTAFSATQAAEALNYMALAGYDAQTSAEMLPKVLNLAAAGGMELAAASDMITDSQTALGLTLEQTNTLVDQMAKASSKSNTSVEQLGEAILTVGGTAKVMKGGTQELNTVLGLLADNGVKGAEGGTALRNILLSLSAPTDKAAGFLAELGVSAFDAEGNMRPMKDTMADLRAALNKLSSEEEKTYFLANIFNKRDLKSVNALLGTSVERWDELSGAIGNAKGAAAQMAGTQLDNLGGSLTILKSALEGLAISVGDVLSPAIRAFAEWVTSLVTKFNELSPATKKIVVIIGTIAAAIGPLLLMGGLMLSTLGQFLITGPKIIGVIKGIGVASKLLNGILAATPWMIVAAAAIAAIILIVKHWDQIKAFFSKLWENIKTVASTAWDGIKTKIVDIAVGLKNGVVSVFKAIGNTLKTIVSTWFKIFTWPYRKAWEFIKAIAEKIRNVFNFDFKLPKIKLPHFSISPKGWSIGDLLHGEIPSLDIDWYKDGAIFTRPTIIGNKGFAEAGAEAALPLEVLWKEMNGMFMRMADSIVTGVGQSLALQQAGLGGNITIPIYLYPSGPKMGEETVKAYDTYKKILG